MTEGGGEPESAAAAAKKAEIRALLQAGSGRQIDRLLPTNAELARQEKQQDIALKKTYARNLLRLMYGQVLVANVVFIVYAWAGKDWAIDPSVMHFWLTATVVQIIGVVYVVTRYLFPRRDAPEAPPAPN
jgi:hypothetical protein